MKKLLFTLFLTLAGTISLKAMEESYAPTTHGQENEEQSSDHEMQLINIDDNKFNSLPNELLSYIIFHLIPSKITSNDDLIQLFKDLHKLNATNKLFNILLNDDSTFTTINNTLIDRITTGDYFTFVLKRKKNKISNKNFKQIFENAINKIKIISQVSCPICNKVCKDRASLAAHNRDIHKTHQQVSCHECNKKYSNKQYLFMHKKNQHNK